MYIYVYICVYMYIYIESYFYICRYILNHMCIYTSKFLHIYMYIYTFIHIYVYVRRHMFNHTCIYICLYFYQIYIFAHTIMFTHKHVHIRTAAKTRALSLTHKCTHAYAHTCLWTFSHAPPCTCISEYEYMHCVCVWGEYTCKVEWFIRHTVDVATRMISCLDPCVASARRISNKITSPVAQPAVAYAACIHNNRWLALTVLLLVLDMVVTSRVPRRFHAATPSTPDHTTVPRLSVRSKGCGLLASDLIAAAPMSKYYAAAKWILRRFI